MCELENTLKNANEEKHSEICRTIQSAIDSGAPIRVLKERLSQLTAANDDCASPSGLRC